MDLLQYTFFQHALLGSLLASIACGIIGTYIVTRRLVFISGGITHASFGGIGLGLFAGISPILSAAIFSVLSAFGVEWLSKRKDMREDSAIAVFWTLGMALGIMFSFLAPGFAPDLSAYLFGNILTITTGDLLMLGILATLLILFFCLFNPIRLFYVGIRFRRVRSVRSRVIPNTLKQSQFEYLLMYVYVAITISLLSSYGMASVVGPFSVDLTIPLNGRQTCSHLHSFQYDAIIWLSESVSDFYVMLRRLVRNLPLESTRRGIFNQIRIHLNRYCRMQK